MMASLDLYWHDDEFVDMDERRIRFIRLGDLSEPSDADKVYKPTLTSQLWFPSSTPRLSRRLGLRVAPVRT